MGLLTLGFEETPTKFSSGVKVYAKEDNYLYMMTSTGVEVKLAKASESNQLLPSGDIGSIQINKDNRSFSSFGNWDGTSFDIGSGKFIGDGSELTGLDFVPFDGAGRDVDLNTKNLFVRGDIGSNAYTDYVNKIYSRSIRLDNLGTPTTNSKILDVVQANPTATATAVYLSNNGLGVAVDIIQDNPLANNQALRVDNDGLAEAITANTDGGQYAISATGGSTASINAVNGINASKVLTPLINSISGDQVQQREDVTKLTHANTLTTIHQALDVQGSATVDSLTADVGGVTSVGAITQNGLQVMRESLLSGYYGILANGSATGWIRTPSEGLLPQVSGGASSNLGNVNWKFKEVWGVLGVFDKSKVNGVTNYGSRTTEPTGTLVAGDKYYLSVGLIGWYTYNGSAWVGDRVVSDFLDLDVTAPVDHVVTATNTDEPFLFWDALGVDSAKNFTLDAATGVYTYTGPSGVKFDGRLSFSGTGSTTNMVCELSIYVDTGSGFTRLTNSIYPVTYDSGAPRLGTHMTTAILNNGYKIKVMLRCTKTGTITYGYIKKQVRQV